MSVTYTDEELDHFEALCEHAAWTLGSDDEYFEFCMLLDPDQSLERALSERNDLSETKRRAALTDAERAAEDATTERLVQKGMAVVRRILEAKRSRQ